MANLGHTEKPSKGIVKMFQKSIGFGKSVALHPHLYSGLYNRASEIKALDKILSDLKEISLTIKKNDYRGLPSILQAIKDTLNGKPHLSWWHLFTLSLGRALSAPSSDEVNLEEKRYLSQISDELTAIIRNYRSTDSRLLLEVRLAALEIDSRLVELEKIPETENSSDDLLDYLSSEFTLFNQQLDRLKTEPPEVWKYHVENLLQYIQKANQLMQILGNAAETQPKTYQQFMQQSQLTNLIQKLIFVLQNSELASNEEALSLWQPPALQDLFNLFKAIPDSIFAIPPSTFCTLLFQAERYFVQDPSPTKVRPTIFASNNLKRYAMYYSEEFTKANAHLRAVIKGQKEDRVIKQYPVEYFKSRFMLENDLHLICGKLRFSSNDLDINAQMKQPSVLQHEILARMVNLANLSQPKELDAVLKSFSDAEKEDRYFLTQEVILEQFIRWRKLGIY